MRAERGRDGGRRWAAASIIALAWAIAAILVFAEPADDEAIGGSVAATGPPPALAATDRVGPTPSPFAVSLGPRPRPVGIRLRQRPRAGLLFDVDTGEVLWALHPRRELPIASLTKMLTALIVSRRHRPGERVRISPRAVAFRGSGVGLLPQGKRVRHDALLKGLLLVSGNDAAIALAEHDAGSVPAFVARMNRRARRMGLRCSRFSSPSGIRDRGNHSCPLDLAALARVVLADRALRRLVATPRARFRFPIEAGVLDLPNINPFIDEPGITGVKTGLTNAAGRCYVVTARRGGRHLGVVLLHAPDPLRQVPRLLRAGFRASGVRVGERWARL